MRKGESTTKIGGIALALVVIGSLFSSFGNTTSGADLPSSGPDPPILILPTNVCDSENFSPVDTLTPVFEWEEVSGVDHYVLSIDYYDSKDKKWVRYHEKKIAETLTSFKPSQGELNLKWGDRCRWSMRSSRAGVLGKPSGWSYFWIGVPTPTQKTVKGIDVSHWQGEISPSGWNEVYKAGYEFAFVKATGATGFTDPEFAANMINSRSARSAGMLMGVYHFAYPQWNTAEDEADYFVRVARNYMTEDYLRPVLDIEDDEKENSVPSRMGAQNLADWIRDFISAVEEQTDGVTPLIYTGKKYVGLLNGFINQDDLWIPHYGVGELGIPSDFWQYSEEGFVPGISTCTNDICVDINMFYGDRSRLENDFVIKDEPKPVSTSDVVLVMDTSGSMGDEWQGETKLRSAKKGANAFVDPMLQGTTLAVVTFSKNADTPVTSTSDFGAAKVAIENLGSQGDTNIGSALTEALAELGAHSEDNAAKAIVLFTDGHITTGMNEDEVLAGPVKEAIDRQIVIHAIGYGDPSYLRSEFLTEMAKSTGGQYYYATEAFQLQNVFIEASQKAEAWDIEATFAGRVKHQETVTAGTFDLGSRVGFLKVTLNWPGSNLDLHIIDPRGREVDYQDSRVTCSDDMKPEYVVIERPLCGTWTVNVHGMAVASETEYRLWIATHAAPPATGSFPAWLLPLLVGIVLLPILVKHMSRRSERNSD